MKNKYVAFILVLFLLPVTLKAAPGELLTGDTAKTAVVPKAEQSVTHHSITIDGKKLNYTATAGTLLLRDGDDKPEALMGYTAYTLDGVKDESTRPIPFS